MGFWGIGLSQGRRVWDDVVQRSRALEEDIKARREADFSGMANGLRARLSEHLELSELPVDADLREHESPFGVARVVTAAYRSPKVRKVVLSHVVVGPARLPVVEGLLLTVFPEYEWDLPCFVAEIVALPFWVSVSADVYGREWQTQRVLSSLRPAFLRLGGNLCQGPLAPVCSGDGLYARLRPRQLEDGFAALLQALGASLQRLADPPPGRSLSTQQELFALLHDAGPRRDLRRVFGEPFAERLSRLLFE